VVKKWKQPEHGQQLAARANEQGGTGSGNFAEQPAEQSTY
jgi:hypothetical protein